MMEKQYEYAGIWIELTRRCNLQCAHCSCGESQNVDISTEIIDRIFVDVKDCGRIVLTGGEPLLRLDMIEYLIDKIGEYRWQTDHLELTTNGLIQDTRIVNLLSRFCGFRKGNRAYLRVSTDEFHDIVASAKALSFYWELCRDIPNITVIPSDKLPVILLRGRAKKLIETHPELAERYFINALDCSLNHRVKIVNDKVICAICVHANGNVGLAEPLSYDEADKDAFGNILNKGLTELVDSHNEGCLVTCSEITKCNLDKKWSWKYIETQFNRYDVIPDRIRSRCINGIFDVVLDLRQKARELYPAVPAQDIIDVFSFDFVKKRIETTITTYPVLSAYKMEKRLESRVREEINEFSQLSAWKDKEGARLGLIGVAYLTQELKKLSIFDLGWVKQQFQRLKDLNEQYQLGQRCWRNDKDYYCDDDKNSRKAV